MKAAVVTQPGKLEILEMPMPQAGPYDCLVKIDACAICTGTDSHIAFGKFPWRAEYPFVIGHESTGIITTCGEKVRYFQTGERVTRPAAVLSNERVHGVGSTWGGYAEWGLVRDVRAAEQDGLAVNGMSDASRNPLPAGVDPVSAALSVNQREILSVVTKMSLDAGTRLAVIGSGYNGLLFGLYGKHFGAGRVVMVGSQKARERAVGSFEVDEFVDYRSGDALDLALARLGGRPTHLIDALGSKGSLDMAQRLMDEHSALGIYGLDDLDETQDVRRDLASGRPALDMNTDEASFVNEWYALWKGGFFDRPGMCDGTVALEEVHSAFQTLASRDAVKIVIRF